MPDDLWLLVGLGNPGPEYAGTRHNVGQMVLDELARQSGVRFAAAKSRGARAFAAEARLGTLPGGAPGPRVVLGKPGGYMNTSGGPVAGLMQYYKVTPDRLLVVHDELDLPFATLRLKRGGGEGGHNGLRDITRALGTQDYLRLRVGIGRPPGRMDAADYVLRDFAGPERKELDLLLVEAADAVVDVVNHGLEAAQQRLHAPR